MRIVFFILEIILFVFFIKFKAKINKPWHILFFIFILLFAAVNIYYNFNDIVSLANKVKISFLNMPTTVNNNSASSSQVTATLSNCKQVYSVISSFTSFLLPIMTFYNNFLKKKNLNIEKINIEAANDNKNGKELRKISLIHKSEKFSFSKAIFPIKADFYICLDEKTFNDDEYRNNLKNNKYRKLLFRNQSPRIYDENKNETARYGDYVYSSFVLNFESGFFNGFLPSEIENNFEIINKMLILEIEYKVMSKKKFIRFFQKILTKKMVQTIKVNQIQADGSGNSFVFSRNGEKEWTKRIIQTQ